MVIFVIFYLVVILFFLNIYLCREEQQSSFMLNRFQGSWLFISQKLHSVSASGWDWGLCQANSMVMFFLKSCLLLVYPGWQKWPPFLSLHSYIFGQQSLKFDSTYRYKFRQRSDFGNFLAMSCGVHEPEMRVIEQLAIPRALILDSLKSSAPSYLVGSHLVQIWKRSWPL